MDIAVNGEGWFSVMSKDGSESYVRTSSMQVTQEGLLPTSFLFLEQVGPLHCLQVKKLKSAQMALSRQQVPIVTARLQ